MSVKSLKFLAPLLLAGCASGGTMDTTASTSGATGMPMQPHLTTGTELLVELDQPIGASAAGGTANTFTATVLESIHSPSGELLVPASAKVEGVVTAYLDGDGRHPRVIGIRFDRLHVENAGFEMDAGVAGVDMRGDAEVGEGVREHPTQAAMASHAAGVPGTVIEDAATFFREDELGPDPGTVVSLGWDKSYSLPQGTRMRIEIRSDMPIMVTLR